jgi:hypothetical protein
MSAKGLEWARKLRAELDSRIGELREALAGIEPLRQELARLEEQQKGVDRLIDAYENQLGFAKPEYLAPRPAPRPVEIEGAMPPLPPTDAVPIPIEAPSPTLVAILRDDALAAIAFCRTGAMGLWAALRVWFSKHFSNGKVHS